MKHHLLAAAAFLAVGYTPSIAAAESDGGTSATDASGVDTKDDEAKVCRRIPVLGSRTGARKVCATPEEWREMNRKTADKVAEERKQS